MNAVAELDADRKNNESSSNIIDDREVPELCEDLSDFEIDDDVFDDDYYYDFLSNVRSEFNELL